MLARSAALAHILARREVAFHLMSHEIGVVGHRRLKLYVDWMEHQLRLSQLISVRGRTLRRLQYVHAPGLDR